MLLTALLSGIVALILCLAVHELGHLLAGSLVGFRFHFFALGPGPHRTKRRRKLAHFEAQAGVVLDLYQRSYGGRPLRPNEYVISTALFAAGDTPLGRQLTSRLILVTDSY